MKKIYICIPYRECTDDNLNYIRQVCKYVLSSSKLPIIPYLSFIGLAEKLNDEVLVHEMNLELLNMCSELWIFGGETTLQMQEEIEFAESNNIPILDTLFETDFQEDLKYSEKLDEVKSQLDNVNSPQHYTFSDIEPLDVIEEWELNFCLGNVIKYIARAGKKGSAILDLRKASFYLNRHIDTLEEKGGGDKYCEETN